MRIACLAAIVSLGLCGAASADVVFGPTTTLVGGSNTIYALDTAVKADGTFGYVYSSNSAERIRYAELGGADVSVSHSLFENFAPRLAYDSAGQAHVIYYKGNDGAQGSSNLYYTHQVDATWQAPTKIGDANAGALGLSIDSDDNVHVSWQTSRNGQGQNHRYRMRTAEGDWQDERIMVNSTSTDWTRAGAHLIAASDSEAYIFTQSRRGALNSVGPARNSPHLWTKTEAGDFTRTMIPPQDYAVHAGANDSTGNVTVAVGGDSYLTSADLMSSAFRGDAIDLAAVQRWTGTSDLVGYVTLYLDILEGSSTPIKLSSQNDAREVNMVIDSSGTHYVFYVAPHDFGGGVTKAALWLQIAEADGSLTGSNVLLSDSTYDVQNVKAAIGSDQVLHLGFIANGNQIRYMSAVIPEPSTAMLGLAAAGFVLLRRRTPTVTIH